MSVNRLPFVLSKIPAVRVNPAVCRFMTTNKEDIETHTGQKWSSDDYRLARFENAPKQVNPNWAIKLIAGVPTKQVTQRVVWCDGGSGPEGHPRVYINLDKPGNHSCGYCGLRFEKKDHH
ncbi:probable NADH dehydrogenase [ubiquinone] iron-sulfur protein 6, mitochondrial [Cydia amplana]|uniref:probable NADH dehydrogenase [ubiquinone] iron-sulfur protein 6, mitochondrial n=1 Tax=Cydia amplana TaxID=1869771 RepID=UPI002FE588BB